MILRLTLGTKHQFFNFIALRAGIFTNCRRCPIAKSLILSAIYSPYCLLPVPCSLRAALYLQLIDISKNQKSISISQRNYQFFPLHGRGPRVGSLLPTAKLPTPYGWSRCLIIITFNQRQRCNSGDRVFGHQVYFFSSIKPPDTKTHGSIS